MGEVAFGKEFNNVTSGKEHPAVRALNDHVTALAILGIPVPWLLNILGSIPGAERGFWSFFEFCGEQMNAIERVRSQYMITGS